MATPAAVHSHFSRKKVTSAAVHSLALAISSLISYWLVTHLLRHVDFVSQSDELLGGMWAVVATVFVFRYSYDESQFHSLSCLPGGLPVPPLGVGRADRTGRPHHDAGRPPR
jgi:hypothetical protein